MKDADAGDATSAAVSMPATLERKMTRNGKAAIQSRALPKMLAIIADAENVMHVCTQASRPVIQASKATPKSRLAFWRRAPTSFEKPTVNGVVAKLARSVMASHWNPSLLLHRRSVAHLAKRRQPQT